jgi:iron complex transport system ATP-binding protein
MVCDRRIPFRPAETIMAIRHLSFSYGTRKILHDISLDLAAGRLCGLLGPNGSGKTTLFKCGLGFLKTSHGAISLAGRPLQEFTPKRLAGHVAYVPQEHQPAFAYSVRQMVEMGRTPHQGLAPILRRGDRLAVEHALDRLGLAHLAQEPYNQLSGGQRQLVLVARALAQEAFLMFMDEPTSSLDFSNQLIVWDAARTIAAEGIGVVICGHDPNHILWFCDQVAALKEGRLLAHGPPGETLGRELLAELYDRPIEAARAGERTFIYPPSLTRD